MAQRSFTGRAKPSKLNQLTLIEYSFFLCALNVRELAHESQMYAVRPLSPGPKVLF